jgi:hypothetical protein
MDDLHNLQLPTDLRAPARKRAFAIALLASAAALVGPACYSSDMPPGGETEGMTDGQTEGMTAASTPSASDPDDDGDGDGGTVTVGDPDDSADDGPPGDDTDTDPASDTTADSGPDPDGCGAGTMCLQIPEGWNGPVAAIDALGSAPSPACEGAFGVASFTAFEGLSAADPDCACDCMPPAGVTCPATSSLNRYDNNVLNCMTQQPDNVHEIIEGCNDIPYYDDDSFRLIVPDLDLAATPCMPQASSTVPPVEWATQVAGCELTDAPAACDGGSCVPEIDDASQRLCVWSEGDVECSGDVFTEKQVLHREVDDTRSCSACSCEAAEGSCGATFTLRAGESCTVASPGGGPEDMCVPIDTPARSVELAYDAPEISCPPIGGDPEGAAAPADAITVCCAV